MLIDNLGSASSDQCCGQWLGLITIPCEHYTTAIFAESMMANDYCIVNRYIHKNTVKDYIDLLKESGQMASVTFILKMAS